MRPAVHIGAARPPASRGGTPTTSHPGAGGGVWRDRDPLGIPPLGTNEEQTNGPPHHPAPARTNRGMGRDRHPSSARSLGRDLAIARLPRPGGGVRPMMAFILGCFAAYCVLLYLLNW